MVDALTKEIALQADYLGQKDIDTLYLGGGTPSLLQPAELEALFTQVDKHFQVSAHAEITLEANPDDVNDTQLHHWRTMGINRLSIGIQSLFDEDLQWMNRAHTAAQAKKVIAKAQKAGFENFTVDLIYGVPTLTDEKWLQNLEWVVAQGVNHLSCYALTVEPRTALDAFIRKKRMQDVDPDHQLRQFHLLLDFAAAAGFEHYEISNFARPGHRSKHNSAYWKGGPYLGIGPSAHSFNGTSRQWNIAHNLQYIQSIQAGKVPFEKEILTPIQQLNEYIMTSLRTMEGCNLTTISERFGKSTSDALRKAAEKLESNGMLKQQSDALVLTRKGKWFADGIAAELFFTG